ncbi:hypothetical protein [Rheinheimera gaetbuli]
MAHEVSINLHTKLVQHKDIEIEVKKDNSRLGNLLISKGNIEWLPAGNSVNKYRLSWAKFAEFMEEHGKNIRIE